MKLARQPRLATEYGGTRPAFGAASAAPRPDRGRTAAVVVEGSHGNVHRLDRRRHGQARARTASSFWRGRRAASQSNSRARARNAKTPPARQRPSRPLPPAYLVTESKTGSERPRTRGNAPSRPPGFWPGSKPVDAAAIWPGARAGGGLLIIYTRQRTRPGGRRTPHAPGQARPAARPRFWPGARAGDRSAGDSRRHVRRDLAGRAGGELVIVRPDTLRSPEAPCTCPDLVH